MSIQISNQISIPDQEIELIPIRAQGAGGQNVNKVASAIHLRFDIVQSSLPEPVKQRLLNLSDQRISNDGIIVIKSQMYRTQEKNREEAINRLRSMIRCVMVPAKKRKATRPSLSARKKRLESKAKRGKTKALRRKVRNND